MAALRNRVNVLAQRKNTAHEICIPQAAFEQVRRRWVTLPDESDGRRPPDRTPGVMSVLETNQLHCTQL